jgi:hypothetical protein
VRSWELPALLDLSLTQPRHYGRDDPSVMERLFALLVELAWRLHPDGQRDAVRRERDLLAAQCRRTLPAGWTEQDVDRRAAAVDLALQGVWPRP